MKNILLIVFISFMSFISSAKFEGVQKLKDKIVFGGNIGLQLGNVTFIDLSPQVGYKVSDKFIPGIGLKYSYFKLKDSGFNKGYSTNIYGGSIWSRYYFVENLFGYLEYEVINLEVFELNFLVRKNVTSVLVGGGYRQAIGNNFGMHFMVLFNLNESIYSIYQNPIIRVGFGFGF